MREFFRGWKRKLGVLTLVMACVLATGWARTSDFHDSLIARSRGWRTEIFMVSSEGGITWQKWQQISQESPLQTGKRSFEWKVKYRDEQRPVMFANQPATKDWCGFRWEQGDTLAGQVQIKSITIPYWSIVLPLTALSGWLLISKSGIRKPSPATEGEPP